MTNSRIRVRARRVAMSSLAIAVTIGAPARSAAQVPTNRATNLFGQSGIWSDTSSAGTAHVAFSFSGGISLGAYQAGVNWAMVQFIKLVRDSSRYRSENHLPTIVPVAMTGASAGNINVLLASIEYCDARDSAPVEESLFWKMWVLTGWNELSPPAKKRASEPADPGVLDRTAIRTRVMSAIDTALRTRPVKAMCRIPIGVVATRIAPSSEGLDRHIQAENQRFVGLFEVREANNRLRLTAASDSLYASPQFGRQLVIPTEDNGELASSRVFDLVEASAAYPVAFAPRVLVYEDPDCVLHKPIPPSCREFHHESFLDGGVFDNNPVGLADHMADRLGHRRATILYVDPDATRGELWNAVQRRADPAAENRAIGVNALLNFGGGFVKSSRKYELQSFIREQLSLPANERAQVQSSTRAHPLVGEHLDAFAAFFGRPFREFDFLTGVADGFQFLASEILCDPERIKATARGRRETLAPRDSADAVGSAVDRLSCIESQTYKLLLENFGLDTADKVVVARIESREFPSTFCTKNADWLDADCQPQPHLPRAIAERDSILLAIERATYAELSHDVPQCDEPGDVSARLLCSDGFGAVLDSLSADHFFKSTISRWANDMSCGTPERTLLRGAVERISPWRHKRGEFDVNSCRAEFLLDNFLTNSHAAMQDLIDRALLELRSVEEGQGSLGNPNQEFLVKTADFVYRSTNLRGRRGVELDASSIPPNEKWYWQAFHFIPYYAGGAVGATGSQFGWKPTWYLPFAHTILDLPVEALHMPERYVRTADYHLYGAVAPGIGHDFSFAWLNQLSVGNRYETGRPGYHQPPFVPQISALTILGKVRVAMYRALPRYPVDKRSRLVGSVSVADLNGIVFWAIR